MSKALPSPGEGVRVLAELGHGAHATVYRAERDGVEYAVKVPDRSARGAEADLLCLRREAAVLARVNHPVCRTFRRRIEWRPPVPHDGAAGGTPADRDAARRAARM